MGLEVGLPAKIEDAQLCLKLFAFLLAKFGNPSHKSLSEYVAKTRGFFLILSFSFKGIFFLKGGAGRGRRRERMLKQS